jgi:hypothetical protein
MRASLPGTRAARVPGTAHKQPPLHADVNRAGIARALYLGDWSDAVRYRQLPEVRKDDFGGID